MKSNLVVQEKTLIIFTVPIEKEVTRTDKNGEEVTLYSTNSNSMIAQNLWHAHYQNLSIIFLKVFIKLNINTGTMKKCKACENKYKYFSCFLEYTSVKVDLFMFTNCKQKFDGKLKKWLFNTYKLSNRDNN